MLMASPQTDEQCLNGYYFAKEQTLMGLVGRVQSLDFWKFADMGTDIRHVQACSFFAKTWKILMSLKE